MRFHRDISSTQGTVSVGRRPRFLTALLLTALASPHLLGYHWIHIPSTGCFTRDRQLGDITSPEFDPENKRVISSWRASCGDHGTSTHKYINGGIRVIEEVDAADDPARLRDLHPEEAGEREDEGRGSRRGDKQRTTGRSAAP